MHLVGHMLPTDLSPRAGSRVQAQPMEDNMCHGRYEAEDCVRAPDADRAGTGLTVLEEVSGHRRHGRLGHCSANPASVMLLASSLAHSA